MGLTGLTGRALRTCFRWSAEDGAARCCTRHTFDPRAWRRAGLHGSAVLQEDGGPRRRSRPAGSSGELPQRSGGQRSAGTRSRVSSELKKLLLEDFPADRQQPWRQRPAQTSRAHNYEVVYGVAPCLLALSQGRRSLRGLYVKDGEASARAAVVQVCEAARRRGVAVRRVGRKDLDKMSSGGVHQGVCLQAGPLGFLTEDSAAGERHATPPLWLVLDRIQDPMNLGAILRSAYFLGVDRVASGLRYSCPLSPVVSKASSGVLEVLGVYGYQDLGALLRSKADQGWHVVGTVASGAEAVRISATPCDNFQMTEPTLLVMGGEGHGLAPELLALCRTLLTIPAGRQMAPGVDSLNVSVATGILLHSLLASRRGRH